MDSADGFRFAGVTCGIKESGNRDLAMIVSDRECVAAGVYTTNLVRAASIDWNREITPTNLLRAVVINSGNANACTGDSGIAANRHMAEETARCLDSRPEQVLVLSTGIIGEQLPMEKVTSGISHAVSELATGSDAFNQAANAILTTDKSAKTAAASYDSSGSLVSISGMCKGAGMIGPGMATMLGVITTNANLDEKSAHRFLSEAVDASFNRISVEGHMSTNDAVLLLASGTGPVIAGEESTILFREHLKEVCVEMARMIPDDGEGASHLISIRVSGCANEADADLVARAIASSNLVKTAIHGADPNWGRIVSAAGYSCPDNLNPEEFGLMINGICVFRDGQPVGFDHSLASRSIADNRETVIEMTMGTGPGAAVHWTSDLTGDYVHFNSAYHT
ncbi:MAG: bifunctional glutamate N-acetyltransferase/amino-acid acetyltransferase ArgJ [Planctomycetota bacterium]